jgi:acyl carrier protein
MPEFLMSTEDIRQVILEILERIAPDEDLTDLKDDVPFRDQMELDSMDFLDIVMELRKMYRVQIPEEDYENLVTMDKTVSYLLPILKDVNSPA